MNRRGLIALMRTSAIVVMAFLVAPEAVPAQKDGAAQKDSKDSKGGKNAKVGQTPTPYNPYPPGILPADLQSELDRVQREIDFIFQQALAEFRALPPPNLTGQPPILQGSGYDMVRTLGKLMNFDVNMSTMKNVACASCHMPYAGFGPPIQSSCRQRIASSQTGSTITGGSRSASMKDQRRSARSRRNSTPS